MLCFVVWEIYFLHLLFGNGEKIGWFVSLNGNDGSNEEGG
jgi:hypothetical protein